MDDKYDYVLKDKVAFVTGGAAGLGRIFVEFLVENGAYVSFIDINEECGTLVAQNLIEKYGKGRVMFTNTDVRQEDKMRDVYNNTIKTFGHLDIVLNNAAIIDEMNFEDTININLTSVIRSTYMAVDRMRKDKGGRGGIIINISSEAAFYVVRYFMAYSATKSGVNSFTKTLSLSLEDKDKYGIRVASMCPTAVVVGMATDNPPSRLIQVTRPADVTQPEPQLNFERNMTNIYQTRTFITPKRICEALMVLLNEADCNGAILEVFQDKMKYLYPEALLNKIID